MISMREPEETIVRNMSKKSFDNKCSYENSWNELITEEERNGFTFDYIYDYMIHS